MSEFGYAVSPRSVAGICRAAEDLVLELAPGHLTAGEALDMTDLLDTGLERKKITVCPVSDVDLPGSEAETRAGTGGWIEIWVPEETYDALFERNSRTVRARSTIGHEIGHAILHRDEVMAGRHVPELLALQRVRRSDVKPYEDSEWQAFAFAGAFLMPRPALRRCSIDDPWSLGTRFLVSEAFARSHIKRVRRAL